MDQESSFPQTQSIFLETFPVPRLSALLPGYLRHAKVEREYAGETLVKYQECIEQVIKVLGDLPISELSSDSVLEFKYRVAMRGAGRARIASLVFALKSFLSYCRDVLHLSVLPPEEITAPRILRREVVFLTPKEVQQFVSVIKLERAWDGKRKSPGVRIEGLRFRALVEVLLGTAMRISEALALNRNQISWDEAEAVVIGKGNKERVVFFTERSLEWLKRYLETRTDDHDALFISNKLERLTRDDVSHLFRTYSKKAGLTKTVTPHVLRHTTATTLLFNGCPISHVKEVLGHELLETTCKYYLGADKRKAKEAHGKYLRFE